MLFHKKKQVDLNTILDRVYSKDLLVRFAEFIVGVFLVSISYNVFLLPSNTVYGVGGIGVILKKLFNIVPAITIFISSMILLVLSLFTLGKKKLLQLPLIM